MYQRWLRMSWEDILKISTEHAIKETERVVDDFVDDEDMKKPKHKMPDIDDGMENFDWMNEYIRKPKHQDLTQTS